MKWKKRYVALGLLLVGLLIWVWMAQPKSYNYTERDLPQRFEDYYAVQLSQSAALNARPGNEERWIKHADEKTDLAFLYIHGFTASRAEGEEVMEWLADKYQANTYFLRLPGHGTNQHHHAETSFREYLDASIDALRMMQTQGDKVVLVGCSMGGLLSTYLAAQYPDLVDALILASPFYNYSSSAGNALKVPGVLSLIQVIDGPNRPMNPSEEFKKLRADGYEKYWYVDQQYQALQSLEDLRNFAARKKYFKKVSAPVLLMAYYKDEQHQDGAASVAAMEKAYHQFASTRNANKLNQLVKLPNANHVMLSRYIQTDKADVKATMASFIDQL